MLETPLLIRSVVMSVVIVEQLNWVEMQEASRAKQARVSERLNKKEGSLFLLCCSLCDPSARFDLEWGGRGRE